MTKEELTELLSLLWLQVWTCPWRRRSWPSSYPCIDVRFGPVRDGVGADRSLTLALTSGLDLSDSYPSLTSGWTCPLRGRSWPSSYPCFNFRFGPVRDEGGADRALFTVRQAGGRSARHLPQWTLQGNVPLLSNNVIFLRPSCCCCACYFLVKKFAVVSI